MISLSAFPLEFTWDWGKKQWRGRSAHLFQVSCLSSKWMGCSVIHSTIISLKNNVFKKFPNMIHGRINPTSEHTNKRLMDRWTEGNALHDSYSPQGSGEMPFLKMDKVCCVPICFSIHASLSWSCVSKAFHSLQAWYNDCIVSLHVITANKKLRVRGSLGLWSFLPYQQSHA